MRKTYPDICDYNTLQCRYKAAQQKIQDFESGKIYRDLQNLRVMDSAHYNRIINDLKKKLADAHSETVSVRHQWFSVFEEFEDEKNKEVFVVKKAYWRMEKRALRAEKQRDDAYDEITTLKREKKNLEKELEEEREKNRKLMAQLNRDSQNSSIPTSKERKNKTIPNGREKTGRRPGGQRGHKGHGRKKQEPTSTRLLPPPQEVVDNPEFKKTRRTITKQMVRIKMILEVEELSADVYYNSKTNEYVHAEFPEGFVNDINYDGSVKAFLYMLNNDCNVSIDKCRKFLSDLTGGCLNISKGMINGLAAEFASKSEDEVNEAFKDFLVSPVLHIDNTNAKVNGKAAFVHVCATPDGKALYFFNEHKGHEGVKGTVAKDYQGILVHDHDTTFYSYGSGHQECNAHILRYLKGSIENEPELTWNEQMHSLMREMIHYRNSLTEGEIPDVEKVAAFEKSYDEILATAKEEYKQHPPGKYYCDGYNLYRRMEEYKANHLLFLHDTRVPAMNNQAERLLRNYKRKQAQAVSFRSNASVEALCKGMSCLVLMRQKDEKNIFNSVAEIFGV